MRNRLEITVFRYVIVATAITASLFGCSLFVSLDDLKDGGKNVDASIDVASSAEATTNDTGAIDAGVDSDAPYLVVTRASKTTPTSSISRTPVRSIGPIGEATLT